MCLVEVRMLASMNQYQTEICLFLKCEQNRPYACVYAYLWNILIELKLLGSESLFLRTASARTSTAVTPEASETDIFPVFFFLFSNRTYKKSIFFQSNPTYWRSFGTFSPGFFNQIIITSNQILTVMSH